MAFFDRILKLLDESDLSPAQGLEMQRGIRFKKRH
jgi:hypothetical protein